MGRLLNFLNRHKFELPNLSKIAKIVFCAVATSVMSECTFSDSGDLICEDRTRLSDVLTEELLMLKRNSHL
jgi:hypothetical protein